MKFRWIILSLLLLALPSVLYARWGKNIVKIKNDATGVIVFNHHDHFDALGEEKCPICHNGIFNRNVSKNPPFTMKDMDQGKACGACHNGDRAFDVKDNDNCSQCHPTHDITFKVPDVGPVVFSHDVHTGMFSCSACHPAIFIPGPGNKKMTMDEMGEGQACGACHDGDTAFSVKDNCDQCHQM